jgi:hypothetical protein
MARKKNKKMVRVYLRRTPEDEDRGIIQKPDETRTEKTATDNNPTPTKTD